MESTEELRAIGFELQAVSKGNRFSSHSSTLIARSFINI